MVTELTTGVPAEGFDRIYYPGEIEADRMVDRKKQGVPIEDGLMAELNELADNLGVPKPEILP